MATSANILCAVLHGTAVRHAVEGTGISRAVEDLRLIAGGRNDLLAQVAGITAGSWLAAPAMRVGHELVAAGLLILAGDGLDYVELERWVRVGVGRGNAGARPIHGSMGTDLPAHAGMEGASSQRRSGTDTPAHSP